MNILDVVRKSVEDKTAQFCVEAVEWADIYGNVQFAYALSFTNPEMSHWVKIHASRDRTNGYGSHYLEVAMKDFSTLTGIKNETGYHYFDSWCQEKGLKCDTNIKEGRKKDVNNFISLNNR